MKSRIIEQLGQVELMLPNLVADALSANDRAKLRMSVLQAAVQHAHDPHSPPPDLAAKCGSAGIDAVAARTLVAGARANGSSPIEDVKTLAQCEWRIEPSACATATAARPGEQA